MDKSEAVKGAVVRVIGNSVGILEHYAPVGAPGKIISSKPGTYPAINGNDWVPYVSVEFLPSIERTDELTSGGNHWSQSIILADLEPYASAEDTEGGWDD